MGFLFIYSDQGNTIIISSNYSMLKCFPLNYETIDCVCEILCLCVELLVSNEGWKKTCKAPLLWKIAHASLQRCQDKIDSKQL